MRIKTVPDVHHNIICAFPDMPILEFYKGYFESVYIILHPFRRVQIESDLSFNADNWPSKKQILKTTAKVPWAEFILLSGFKNIKQVDLALRNNIGGLIKKHENPIDSTILKKTLKHFNIIVPEEGQFSEFFEADMLNAILDDGHECIYVGDEFGGRGK